MGGLSVNYEPPVERELWVVGGHLFHVHPSLTMLLSNTARKLGVERGEVMDAIESLLTGDILCNGLEVIECP